MINIWDVMKLESFVRQKIPLFIKSSNLHIEKTFLPSIHPVEG